MCATPWLSVISSQTTQTSLIINEKTTNSRKFHAATPKQQLQIYNIKIFCYTAFESNKDWVRVSKPIACDAICIVKVRNKMQPHRYCLTIIRSGHPLLYNRFQTENTGNRHAMILEIPDRQSVLTVFFYKNSRQKQ